MPAKIGFFDARIIQQVAGLPRQNNPAAIHHRRSVGDRKGWDQYGSAMTASRQAIVQRHYAFV